MTLFIPLLFVCSAMATNPHHCETIKVPEVTATVEACSRKLRKEAERLANMDPRPFPHLPGDWLVIGQCSTEVLYETMMKAEAP